jgi:hypothetical protein
VASHCSARRARRETEARDVENGDGFARQYGAVDTAPSAELNRERTTLADAVIALTDLIVGSLDTTTDR